MLLSINRLVEQIDQMGPHTDADLRFMALSDLNDLLRNPETMSSLSSNSELSNATWKAVLKHLSGEQTEVQNLAVKCLEPIAASFKVDTLTPMLHTLIKSDFTVKYQAIKTMIGYLPTQIDYATRLAELFVTAFLNTVEAESEPTRTYAIRFESVDSDLLDVTSLFCERFVPVLHERKDAYMAPSLRQSLFALSIYNRGLVARKAVQAFTYCAPFMPDTEWKVLEQRLLQSLSEGQTQTKNVFNLIASLARQGTSEFKNAVPVIWPSMVQLFQFEDLDEDMELIEQRESLLGFIDSVTSSYGVQGYMVPAILTSVRQFLSYDPFYLGLEADSNSDDSEEEMDENEDGFQTVGDDVDGDGADFEFGDFDEDDEYEVFEEDGADNDDRSWVLRKAAARSAKALVTLPVFEENLFPLLVDRLARERDENVKLELIATISTFLETISDASAVDCQALMGHVLGYLRDSKASLTIKGSLIRLLQFAAAKRLSFGPNLPSILFEMKNLTLSRALICDVLDLELEIFNWCAATGQQASIDQQKQVIISIPRNVLALIKNPDGGNLQSFVPAKTQQKALKTLSKTISVTGLKDRAELLLLQEVIDLKLADYDTKKIAIETLRYFCTVPNFALSVDNTLSNLLHKKTLSKQALQVSEYLATFIQISFIDTVVSILLNDTRDLFSASIQVLVVYCKRYKLDNGLSEQLLKYISEKSFAAEERPMVVELLHQLNSQYRTQEYIDLVRDKVIQWSSSVSVVDLVHDTPECAETYQKIEITTPLSCEAIAASLSSESASAVIDASEKGDISALKIAAYLSVPSSRPFLKLLTHSDNETLEIFASKIVGNTLCENDFDEFSSVFEQSSRKGPFFAALVTMLSKPSHPTVPESVWQLCITETDNNESQPEAVALIAQHDESKQNYILENLKSSLLFQKSVKYLVTLPLSVEYLKQLIANYIAYFLAASGPSCLSIIKSCPKLLEPHLPELLPRLYESLTVDKSLITTVQMGVYKLKVDKGLETRKGIFEILYASLSVFDLPLDDILQRVTLSLESDDDKDIKILCCSVIIRILEIASQNHQELNTASVKTALMNTSGLQIKESAVKHEADQHKELMANAASALKAINNFNISTEGPSVYKY